MLFHVWPQQPWLAARHVASGHITPLLNQNNRPRLWAMKETS